MTAPAEPTTPPRLVIFDMDDVLLRYDVAARRTAIGAMAGLSADDVARLIWDSGIEDASDLGHLSPDTYLEAIAKALGVPFGRADWQRTRALAMTLDPDVLALVPQVSARARIALLTNNGHIMREHFDVLVPELRALFGPAMHVACEFGAKKPTPAVYKGLAALYGVAPQDAVMIDDKPANVAGALEAGLRAHLFTRAAELATFLRAHHMVA
ncbi:HAD family hydrolase [Ancylobacter sp.]|uniref:HAD family hydrolase n=1 Tax=Ancylobacter sp. TaxID=1872567 RepID=UPI003D0D6006